MRTPRLLIAATAAALTITALTGCTAALYGVADPSHPATTATPKPDGRYNTPSESQARGGLFDADWVRLPDGRKVLCVSQSGISCNWDDIRAGDSK